MNTFAKIAVVYSPEAVLGVMAYTVLVGAWILATIFVLVCPALAHGQSARTGLKLVVRNLWALFLLVGVMQFVPLLAAPGSKLWATMLPINPQEAGLLDTVIFSLVKTVYLLAIGAAAVIFVAGAMRKAREDDELDQIMLAQGASP